MNNAYLFRPHFDQGNPPYIISEKFFTEDECDYIIDIGQRCNVTKSIVAFDPSNPNRKSKNSWISNNYESEWIYNKLSEICLFENSTKFKFELNGFYEDIQYTVYEDNGDFYKCHRDSGQGILSIRKLSIVVMLSDPSEYEGGNLEIFVAGNYVAMPKIKGSLVIFPSYEWHRVTEVTKGIRRSLVVWVSGPPLR